MELCEATQVVKGSAFLTYALRQRHSAMRRGPPASASVSAHFISARLRLCHGIVQD